MGFRRCKSRVDLFLRAAVVVLYAVSVHIEAPWGLFSIYCGWIVPVPMLSGVVIGFRRYYAQLPLYSPRPVWGWVKRGVQLLALLSFSIDFVHDVQGHFFSEPALDMAYPLQEGLVGHGGSTEGINYHNADTTAQQYAMDIEALYPTGNRAKGLFPQDPHKYAIYGHAVYAPCNGRVAMVRDGHENTAMSVGMDTVNPAGNMIVLEYQNHLVVFAHLLKHSITVAPGQQVVAGQPMARVGNSGNTTEPHLHIHAIAGSDTGKILNGNGIPITFDGRFLVRNDRFDVKDFEKALKAFRSKASVAVTAVGAGCRAVQSFARLIGDNV